MCYEKSVNIFEQNMRERELVGQKLQCASVEKGLQPGLRGKKRRLSKKMQNILLLNSENSIPALGTPAEF